MSKVLIVDDEAAVRNTLVRLVESNRHEVTAVESGAEAISSVEQEPPDVVLIDLLLDDMPGLAVMKQIKSIHPAIECIIVTGAPTKDSAISAVNLGAFGFVTKPWDDAELLVMIKGGVRQTETTRALLANEVRLKELLSEKGE